MEAQHLGASLASLCHVTTATSIPVSTAIGKSEVVSTLWVWWGSKETVLQEPWTQGLACGKHQEYCNNSQAGTGRSWGCRGDRGNFSGTFYFLKSGETQRMSEENGNANRRKHRYSSMKMLNTKFCKCSFCTRFCSQLMWHGIYQDTAMILKDERYAPSVPDDERPRIEPL